MAFSHRDDLDDAGTINIRAGGSWPGFPLSSRRDDGKVDDISAAPLFFEVIKNNGSALRKALIANPADASGRLVPPLTVAECADLRDGSQWAIWDEAGGQRLFLTGGLVAIYG